MFDKRLLSLVPDARRLIALDVVLQWIGLLATIALFFLIGDFLQALLAGQATTALSAELAVSAAIAVVVRYFAQSQATRMGGRAAALAKRTVRQKVYDKLVRLGPAYKEQVPTSEAVQVCVEGSEQLEAYFSQYLPQLFYALLAPLTLFACLAPVCLPAAVALLVCVPLIPLSIMAVMRVAKRVTRGYWNSYTDLGASFLESVQGLVTLKVYQADAERHRAMNDEAEGFRRATMRLLRTQLSSIAVMDLFAFGGAALGIVLVVNGFAAGQVTFAGAFTMIFLSAEFFLPLRALGSFFHTAMGSMAVAEKMFAILDKPEPARGTKHIDRTRGVTVSARGVGYSYDGKRQVLEDVDFDARPGGLVGIAGPSGSGKSTFADIVSGNAVGFTGKVSVGGVDVREADPEDLRRSVVYVGHDSHLFKGSVRDNLLLADPGASEERMEAVLASVRLSNLVAERGGLDAHVAEGGANLSGGQRQRLSVARALLADAPVYVFDEATSSIDAESDAVISRLVAELAHTRTVVVIAHRLSLLKDADAVYVFQDGRVVERGTHDQLVGQDGCYASMWEKQAVLERRAAAEMAAGDGQEEDESVVASGQAQETQAAGEGASAASPHGEKSREGQDAPAPKKHRSGLAIMARMVKLVRPLVPVMVLACAFGVLGFFAAIFLTVLGTMGVLDLVGAGAPVALSTACALVVVCGVVRGPLRYGEQLCNHYLAFRILALVRDRVFGALRKLAPARMEARDKGDLVSLATSDVELLEVFYAHTLSPVVIAIVVSAVMIAFIGSQGLAFGLVAVASYAVVGIVVPLFASRAGGNGGMEVRAGMGRLNAFVLDSLQGLRETLQFGGERRQAKRLDAETDEVLGAEARLKGSAASFMAATGAVVTACDVVMLLVGAAMVASGQASFSQAALAAAALMSSFGPVIAVANLGSTLHQTLASGERVLDLLDEPVPTAEVVNGVELGDFEGAAMDEVRFSYDGTEDDLVLDGTTLSIEPGEVVQVSGPSGSGKSTLLKLLMRFWDPQSGVVSVSGVDLRRATTASLRSAEGMMEQETHLFTGTIRDNLLIARPDADDDELHEALRKAALDDFVGRLPKGLDTPLGELGDALSGGERQRLGLARVFLHDAPLMLLDEPTSNLDALSEASVLSAVEQNRAGHTVVLVSHRATTSAMADRVYDVVSGRWEQA